MIFEDLNPGIDRVRVKFDRMRELPDDDEIRSDWSRYLCVLTAGLLETALNRILGEYVASHSEDDRIIKRLNRKRDRHVTPGKNRIIQALGDFDEEWRREMSEFLAGEYGAVVDSVMNNRNRIAHGGDVGLTPDTMKRQFDGVIRVIERIDSLVLGDS